MKTVNDFFNKLASELDKTYFPNVKYYRDDKKCTNVHYAVECFNNGVSFYHNFIDVLSKNCNESKENMHKIVSKYVEDFEGYEYNA